ncbi:MAG: DUF2066 domain-containing protein [Candidatus Berkiellales bacterium]
MRSFVAALFFLFCPLVQAVVMPHMYEATLSCQTQSEEERQTLLKQGFIQVVERINSQTEVAAHPAVVKALEKITDYVEQYSYDNNAFTVKFNADLINRLIEKTGSTTWGKSRPRVVLWLALEENQQRRLLGAESDPTLQVQLTKLAEQRGLPIVLPLMDLEDVSKITVADVWGEFPTVLRQASERYGSQAILVGRITHVLNASSEIKPWQVHWQLLTDSDSPVWQAEGQALEAVLDQGLSGTANYLLGHYGVKNSASAVTAELKTIFVTVQEVRSGADFSQVEAYLKSLDPISKVNVNQITGDGVVFEITPRQNNDHHTLQQAISLDRRLVSLVNEPGTDLAYRWVRE